jgi:hypothetical protein
MFAEAWHRYRVAKKEAKCLRAITRLGGRAAVREAEQTVAAAWIQHLGTTVATNPLVSPQVELELESHAQASRERSAESARDVRQLADISAQIAAWKQEAHDAR